MTDPIDPHDLAGDRRLAPVPDPQPVYGGPCERRCGYNAPTLAHLVDHAQRCRQ